MLIRWLFAAVHLLALGIGLGAIWARGRALREPAGPEMLRRVFRADTWWAVAAALWFVTGAARAFGGLEKGTAYYVSHPLFHAKLGLFFLIVGLEIAPMIGLIQWRRRLRRGESVDTARAGLYAGISTVQAILVIVMVGLAAALARGLGA